MEFLVASLAICSLFGLSDGQELSVRFAMIADRDFPNETHIYLTQTMTETLCSMECYRHSISHMFCYDQATYSCYLHRLPVAGNPYVCHEIFDTCHVDSLRCYSKVFGNDVFLGYDIKPFDTDATTNSGKVSARNIPSIPMQRKWQWKMPKGKVLKLTFTALDLGPCGCPCASIKIRKIGSEEPLLGHEYCGSQTVPFTITIPTNDVELFFDHDGSDWLDGFDFDYESFTAFFCDPTTVGISDTSGIIEAVDILDLSQSCLWNVMTPAGTVMRVTFEAFDIGPCCTCQTLTIIDMAFTDVYLVNTCGGAAAPSDVECTMSNSIQISFVTDGSAMSPGFRIYFESFPEPPSYGEGSNVAISGGRGFIRPSSVFQYASNANYMWRITADPTQRIGLYFVYINTENPYDTVDVLEGGTSLISGPLSGLHFLPYFETAGNTVDITFISDFSIEFNGFLLFFKCFP